jgi:hypothetical protein
MWNTYIQFVEWDAEVRDTSTDPVEAARLLMWSGNLRVHCPCPSFKWWGYQYILTQLDAAIDPNDLPNKDTPDRMAGQIFPKIRNPHLKGICCKHLRRTIKVLPFHLGDMAQAIKHQRSHF